MAIANNFRIEIVDVGNTSGAPVLSWVYSEGGLDGDLQTDFAMKFQNEGERYATPVLLRGIGPSLSANKHVQNPAINVNLRISGNRTLTGYNDNWTDLSNAAYISGLGLQPDSGNEAAFQNAVLNGLQTMYYSGTGGLELFGAKRGRNDVIRLFDTGFRVFQTSKSGTQEAWISYDMSSGMNNKKVFAYSIEILQKVSGVGDNIIQQSGQEFTASELDFYSGFAYSGQCNQIRILIDNTGVSCVLPEELESDEPIEVCLQSGLTSGAVQEQINAILDTLRLQQTRVGTLNGDPIDDSAVTTDGTSLRYSIYQGVIKYNFPYSGDYICIEPYDYDYTGTYSGLYDVAPPYPAYQACFSYPQDYTSISGLVNKINTVLSGSGYYLWNPNVCTDDSLSGYFESGGILKATQSGDNDIIIEAMREGAMGRYRFTFFAADRPETGAIRENSIKYLLPKKITLQGRNAAEDWANIDTRNNIEWGKIRATVVRDELYDIYTGFNTGANGRIQEESGISFGASGSPVRRLVYQANVTGKNVCQIPFDKRVDFYEIPSGFACAEADEDTPISNDFSNETGATTGLLVRPVDYFFLKTGWKFNNTSGYNFYRLVLENLVSEAQTQNVDLAPSFYVNGISFYGYETGANHLTGSMCLIGANYTGQVMGLTSGIVTGTITGEANAVGELCVNNYTVTGVPNGNGWVRFQRSSGQATSLFTGLVTACETGTGYYVESVFGYFYNAASQCVQFTKDVSGVISGSGELTGGPYPIIRDSVIPSITETQTVAGVGEGILTGLIPDFAYNFTDVYSFGILSGTWSDVVLPADSGSIVISEIIYGIPAQVYSVAVSGYQQASAVLTYNSPASGDMVFINDTVIIYDPNTGNLAPTYFKSAAELAWIVNENSGVFLATGYEAGGDVYLFSTEVGAEGNVVPIRTSGSAGVPTFGATGFTGGATYHFPMTPTDAFSGLLQMELFATQSFSVSGSGYLTGVIKQLDFVRYFTGIWGLSSGDLNFQILGWVTGGNRYQNSGFSGLPFFSGKPDIVPLLVTYNNSPLVLSNDFARLTVTGYGTETGISMILSGQY